MFTGLIQEIGTVRALVPHGEGYALTVEMPRTAPDAALGDSIAINGACLTVTAVDGARVSMDAVAETIRRTTLGDMQPGARVNVEASLRVGDKMGGHWVLGHVDGMGRVTRVTPEPPGVLITVSAPEELMQFVVDKGSVAIDGISLTIAAWTADGVTVSVIPTTLAETTLGTLRAGTAVNLEMDLIGKYVHRYLGGGRPPTEGHGLTLEQLRAHGF